MTGMRCVAVFLSSKTNFKRTLPWLMCSFVIHGYICGCDWFWRWVEISLLLYRWSSLHLISSVRLLPLGFSITSIFPSAFWLSSPWLRGCTRECLQSYESQELNTTLFAELLHCSLHRRLCLSPPGSKSWRGFENWTIRREQVLRTRNWTRGTQSELHSCQRCAFYKRRRLAFA